MIEIFVYLQHFQTQVEIFKEHINTGISSSHNTGFAECLHPIIPIFFHGTITGYPNVRVYMKLTIPFTDFQDTILNTDREVNGYRRKC